MPRIVGSSRHKAAPSAVRIHAWGLTLRRGLAQSGARSRFAVGPRRNHATGRVNQKVLPEPPVLSTPMPPPWASTASLQKVRPRPVP